MKNIKLLLLLLSCSLLNLSCLEDDGTGELIGIEDSPYIVGFNKSNGIESFFEDVGPVNLDLGVDIIGGGNGVATTTSIEVFYSVDTDESTATEGSEFSLTGSSFTIPAGADFGILPIQINTGSLDPDLPTTLVLKLTSSSNGVVSAINDTFALTFVGCSSDHAGDYICLQTVHDTAPNTTITELAPNTYRIGSMPLIAFGGGGGAPASMDFTNICGEINLTQWVAGTLIDGSGVFDETAGTITFDSIIVYNGNDVASGVWFDLGTSVYTLQ